MNLDKYFSFLSNSDISRIYHANLENRTYGHSSPLKALSTSLLGLPAIACTNFVDNKLNLIQYLIQETLVQEKMVEYMSLPNDKQNYYTDKNHLKSLYSHKTITNKRVNQDEAKMLEL